MNDAPAAMAIQVTALEKTYRGWFGPGQHALRGLSLSIPRGSAFGLIGPNGAGKTTLIKVLLGVVRPSSGDVRILGGDPDDPAIRARLGYLPERMHLPNALRAEDFLFSVATLKSARLSKADAKSLLDRVGLRAGRQRIGSYSKGMRQRLGLAAALVGAPELLILDEPTDGIDPAGRIDVRKVLLEERARGATLLLNSHLLSETEKVCDRIGVLNFGQLKREGTLESLTAASPLWRLKFDTANEALPGLGLRADGPAYTFDGDTEALDRLLVAARASGAKLIELKRDSNDLEAVLGELLTQ